jgi:hypothetical protein
MLAIAPIIAMILQLLSGFAGSHLATKYGPKLAKMGLKAISPGVAGKVMEGAGRGMQALRGAGRFGGVMGGFAGGQALASSILGDDIHELPPSPELPPDATVDDIGQSVMPFLDEEQRGLQQFQAEEQLRMAMEQLGIDYDEFMLQHQGGIV